MNSINYEVERAPGSLKLGYVSLQPFRSSGLKQWVDPVDPAVARLFSETEARFTQSIPYSRSDSTVFIAAVDPEAFTLTKLVEKLSEQVVIYQADLADIEYAHDRVYGLPSHISHPRIGEILVLSDMIDGSSLTKALRLQRSSGSRLGSTLTSQNAVNHIELAEAVARQKNLPLIDLLSGDMYKTLYNDESLDEAWGLMPESFWFRHLVVPLSQERGRLVVAMVDPEDNLALEALSKACAGPVRVFVTGYRDIVTTLNVKYGQIHEKASRVGLLEQRPEDSAYRQLSKPQTVFLLALLASVILSGVLAPVGLGIVISALLDVLYATTNVFRLWMMYRSTSTPPEIVVTDVDLDKMDLSSLPEYTVLVPLYKEAAVLPIITRAIAALRYPKDRLDVKFLLEEDDAETIEAARNAGLPNYVDLVVVPASEPRTKPKACNYGVMKARGEYLVIFDAEDIPEPDQLLKAVAVFRSSPEDVACVQAKLSYFNSQENILTRWFTAEYANWFELLLPALFSMNLPIPLGGTSNHLKTSVLMEQGAWDPYNVTEDADLGIRLHKAGYRTVVMNSTTEEEANANFVNWVRQRSRWVKGYIQTWLVHMRHPRRLYQELGPRGFFGFHLVVGGTPLIFLLNPLLWALTLTWFVFQAQFIQSIYPGWIFYLGAMNLLFGNLAFTFSNVVGLARRKNWSLVKYAVLSPIYWVFMSIAAWKGLFQLVTRPSYWEKTVHGITSHDVHVLQESVISTD